MAPIRPRPRKPHRSSTATTTHTPTSSKPPTITNPINSHTHPRTKILKRRSKHSALLSRLHASNSPRRSSAITKTQRRRPGKKTPLPSLSGLEDALPDADADEWEGFEDGAGARKVKMKSAKTGKGSMRKREKAMVGERERFVRNLGVLVGGSGGRGAEGDGNGMGKGSSERWKAIRRFIEGGEGGGGV
ncbi:MAG: hypothetical protein OHK93_005306 [Ramalina farinacea]|uniref:Ribosome biogenesis protein SLX9 n=1 Tax=Ramalina farinacea TaxID=258253 RepID=A0AA43TVV8_9LECA|nr:hypothetical protein [Ramalina farinacea]